MSEVRPVRIQLSRKKGFNLQAHSRSINGLEAVNCARPGRWGNPYRVGTILVPNAAIAVEVFEANLPLGLFAKELRGKNLACWCKIGAPCHADVLLEVAMAETNEVAKSPRPAPPHISRIGE